MRLTRGAVNAQTSRHPDTRGVTKVSAAQQIDASSGPDSNHSIMPALDRRGALRVMASATATILGAPAVLRGRFQLFGQQGTTYSARAIKLVEETVVIDMLNQFRFPDFAA